MSDSSETDIAPFDDFSDTEFRTSDSGCYVNSCDGVLLYHNDVLVCDTCSATTGLDSNSRHRREHTDIDASWKEFWERRPHYPSSGRPKMVGGFLEPYDWVSSDEVDGQIQEVAPGEFYRG